MMMERIVAPQPIWLLVRVKRHQIGPVKQITVGGEFESYKDRRGLSRQRRIRGTGKRVFLPEHLLRKAGFEVFLPVEWKWRKANRFSKEKVQVCYPKLVDWMFVAITSDDDWHRLMSMDVVLRVMGSGGRPTVLKSSVIVALMERWGGGQLSAHCHEMVKRKSEFDVGDEVEICVGPFQGFPAKVSEIGGSELKVVMSVFGRDTLASFQADQLTSLV